MLEKTQLEDNDDLEKICAALSDVSIARNMHPKTILFGVHVFLAALVSAGKINKDELAEDLHFMADYISKPVN